MLVMNAVEGLIFRRSVHPITRLLRQSPTMILDAIAFSSNVFPKPFSAWTSVTFGKLAHQFGGIALHALG